MKRKLFLVIAAGVFIVSIYGILGDALTTAYKTDGHEAKEAYNIEGSKIFPDTFPVPIPRGALTATESILLPDLHQTGKGFTCTGLAYDSTSDAFLVGDINALLPTEQSKASIVRLSKDFRTVLSTIALYDTFPNMAEIQGIAFDADDNTIWFCSPAENKVRHINAAGASLGEISTPSPTGISHDSRDGSFWILSYDGMIRHIGKTGTIIESFAFAYDETLDQCFLDEYRGLLYMTAGSNYSSRNNIYCFDTSTHDQYIACTVDSYAVEGIWLGDNDKMIILNDGYYHSSVIDKNLANIYTIN